MGIVEKLIQVFPLSRAEVELLIKTAPRRYKVHEIEKRNGRGVRTIAQPTAEIKLLQRFLVEEYVSKLPISEVAKAYRKGLSIADHAIPHARNSYLLKLDFRNFFPTIRGVDFLRHLRKYSEVEREDAECLVKLFFWRPKGRADLILSIGAPSSPAVSNTLMFDFDSALSTFCANEGVTYTRYADDLAFSTNKPHVLKSVHEYASSLSVSLKYPRLVLNAEKTVYTSKKHHRHLTGLVLANDGTASLGREKKRLLRSMAYRYKIGTLSGEEHAKLRGWVAFCMSVDQPFVESLRKMLGETLFQVLMKG